MGLMGMAQVIATIADGIQDLRRGKTTWSWPDFNPDPVQENLAQLSRWSLNAAPTWEFSPLAIANQFCDQQADEVKRARYLPIPLNVGAWIGPSLVKQEASLRSPDRLSISPQVALQTGSPFY